MVTDRERERRSLAGAAAIAEAAAGPGGFAEHFDEAPVILVLLADLASWPPWTATPTTTPWWAAPPIYPFAWSILLAARAEGLAGVMTTMLVRQEAAVKALLGVPDTVTLAGVLALGYPVAQPTRLRRAPVDSFTTVDRFDGPPLGPLMARRRAGRHRSVARGEGPDRGGHGRGAIGRRRPPSAAWSTTSTSSGSTPSGFPRC